jgi:peptidoglycan hydrolase-like protein with peptidoglycan-binding domain
LVRRLQTALRELGHGISSITGKVGPQTRAAIDRFAGEAGLPPGREPDEAMLARVEETLRLRQEQVAQQQRALHQRAQVALLELGYDLGVADGVFGSQSRRALGEWLRARGREPRGEVDETLVDELESAVVTAATVPPLRQELAALPPASPPRTTTPEPAPAPSLPPAAMLPAPVAAPNPIPSVPAPTTIQRQEPVVAAVKPTEPPVVGPQLGTIPPRAAVDDKRVALVIGNSAYQSADSLKNPRRDAEDIAAALADIGFEVLQGFDLDSNGMNRLTRDFARKAETADLAMAYYSGHGLQFDNRNYLVPVDAVIEDAYDLRSLFQLEQLISDTSGAKKLAIVVVDACRNDPLQASLTRSLRKSLGSSRSATLDKGLAAPGDYPAQTLITYATTAGDVAYDGNGQNSPYVAALLRHLKTPDVDVRILFGRVRDDVARATAQQQRPEVYQQLGGEEVFLVRTPPRPSGLELAELTDGERRLVQRSLKWLGLWEGEVDGASSDWLLDTVRRYQRDHGDKDTGRLSPSDILALHRQARYRQPREPLPPVGMLSLFRRLGTGDPEALRLAGMIADPAFEAVSGERKDADEAARFYLSAAEKGDTVAAARLGMLLSASSRPPQDQAAARRWLEQAARSGDAAAALRLAELMLTGPNAAAGRSQAVALLRTAMASPETDGLAAARLRDLGEPVVR